MTELIIYCPELNMIGLLYWDTMEWMTIYETETEHTMTKQPCTYDWVIIGEI